MNEYIFCDARLCLIALIFNAKGNKDEEATEIASKTRHIFKRSSSILKGLVHNGVKFVCFD